MLAQLVKSSIQIFTFRLNCSATANQSASEPLKVLAKEKINFKFPPFMQNTKHYFHNNAYNGVSCWIFHIVQLKFVFSLVLEFTRCFAVKYWWVLHWSYITACFCMLFLVLSYIRRHYMTKSLTAYLLTWHYTLFLFYRFCLLALCFLFLFL